MSDVYNEIREKVADAIEDISYYSEVEGEEPSAGDVRAIRDEVEVLVADEVDKIVREYPDWDWDLVVYVDYGDNDIMIHGSVLIFPVDETPDPDKRVIFIHTLDYLEEANVWAGDGFVVV
jgi:hypothetical protein